MPRCATADACPAGRLCTPSAPDPPDLPVGYGRLIPCRIDGWPEVLLEDEEVEEGTVLEVHHGGVWHLARTTLDDSLRPAVRIISAAWPTGPGLVAIHHLEHEPVRRLRHG